MSSTHIHTLKSSRQIVLSNQCSAIPVHSWQRRLLVQTYPRKVEQKIETLKKHEKSQAHVSCTETLKARQKPQESPLAKSLNKASTSADAKLEKKILTASGADLGGGCRGCAPLPEMTCGFLIQLVLCKKKNYVVYWC